MPGSLSRVTIVRVSADIDGAADHPRHSCPARATPPPVRQGLLRRLGHATEPATAADAVAIGAAPTRACAVPAADPCRSPPPDAHTSSHARRVVGSTERNPAPRTFQR